MEQSGFVVGLDLGTSKIVGLMGRKNEQGVISIIASESIPSDNCVKYGIVYNIDEAAGKIKKIINLLENKTGRKIGKVYVSVAGKSLRTIGHVEIRDLLTEREITFADVDTMEQKARLIKPEFLANYSVVAPEIFLDNRLEEDFIGKTATIIEGRYQLISGRPNIKTNLVKCISEKNGLGIAGYIVGPLAAGTIVLEEEDKQAGCALVDFGAGTTTLSIYKGGLLRYMIVIPFGGKSVTKDIKELGFIETAAESYKIKYGKVGKNKNKSLTSNNEVDVKELNKVIQLRVEEIVLNVVNQIKESGYADQLEAGIIMIGGASRLNGLDEFLEEKSKLPVKKGVAKRLYINNVTDLLQDSAYAQALGLLLFANENCEKREAQPAATATSTVRSYFDQEPARTAPSASRPTSTSQQNAEPVVDERIIIEEEIVEEEILTEKGIEEPIIDEKPQEPVVKEKEPIKEIKETPSRFQKNKKSHGILDLFGKIQNLGGTMFKDED